MSVPYMELIGTINTDPRCTLRILGMLTICSWIAFTWYFLYYEITEYLIKPAGNWSAVPGLCCELKQVIPLYTHVAGSVFILLLGPLQLVNLVRKLPLHSYTGALYAMGCFAASIGGLFFVMLNGTVGDVVISAAFTTYGFLVLFFTPIVLMSICMAPQLHWEFAFRLFWLASASPMYRLLYILACTFGGVCGMPTFTHPIDYAFAWLFFMIPMLIAEIFVIVIKCMRREDRFESANEFETYNPTIQGEYYSVKHDAY